MDSCVLAQWQGEDVFDASAESYGGINTAMLFATCVPGGSITRS